MMATFYKATRPDGRSFHDDRVVYAVGRTVRPRPLAADQERRLCGPGYLHVADVPAETLIGGSWPCALWRVEAISRVQQGHKHGVRQLRVLEQLPAWQAFGPNGQGMAEFIDVEIPRVAGAVAAMPVATWSTAWSPTWLAARDAAWAAAAGDAALAHAVRDLITTEQFVTLTRPWRIMVEAAEA